MATSFSEEFMYMNSRLSLKIILRRKKNFLSQEEEKRNAVMERRKKAEVEQREKKESLLKKPTTKVSGKGSQKVPHFLIDLGGKLIKF